MALTFILMSVQIKSDKVVNSYYILVKLYECLRSFILISVHNYVRSRNFRSNYVRLGNTERWWSRNLTTFPFYTYKALNIMGKIGSKFIPRELYKDITF